MAKYIDNIIAEAAAGALVLTANKRLFRHLREQFDQQMIAAGKAVWSTPQIFSFDGWLNRCLEELGEGWRLINSHQQRWLWEEEIEKSSRGTRLELLQIAKTAEKAIQAHRLLSEYNVSLEGEFLTEDQRVFQTWQSHYRNLCRKRDWLDPGELPRYLCAALTEGRLDIPQSLLLVGFDQLTPGLRQLMGIVRGAGGVCQEVALSSGTAGWMIRFAATDSRDEMETAARWARKLLGDGASSIGIVVPDLQARRRQIEQIFRQQIDPQAIVALDDEESVFGLSLGEPLADQGVIYAALQFLATGARLTLDQISFLLRTPYLDGAITEADSRALFEQRLRSFRQQSFKLSHLLSLTAEKPDLARISAILKLLQDGVAQTDRVLPGVWAERFATHLHSLGWPGERPQASSEYQAVNVWQEKGLAVLLALDSLQQPINRSRALQLLRRGCQEIEFQLESTPGPIQVVGLLESSGLDFAHLWVMGMGETTLPARPQPNPFIPLQIQRQCKMPHASAERELQFAEQVMARLQVASPNIVFSYPAKEGDTPLRPSPLIPDAAVAATPTVADRGDIIALLGPMESPLEAIADHYGPKITKEEVTGGTKLLQDQAHCPFRAFIHHRLKGEKLATSTPGIDPLSRGNLLHLVLEIFWAEVGDHATLLLLDDRQRLELVEKCVAAAIDNYYSGRTSPEGQLLKLEAERMTVLVGEWLQKEIGRKPFRVVKSEQQHIEQVGPLQIRLKVDRVDELADGRWIVIDYKTGNAVPSPKDFLSRPLIEPQLPVYAVADGEKGIDGVVFARLRRGDYKFVGMACEDGLLGGVKSFTRYQQGEQEFDSWNDVVIFWRDELVQLADDFAAGKAMVQPYDVEKSCKYCDLIGICRISEANSVVGEE